MAKKDLNTQTNKERQNAAQYDCFADAFELAQYPGFAKFMRHAAEEEREHYQKFAGYMIDRGWEVTHTALDAPQSLRGDKPLPIFQAALTLEIENTNSINALYKKCDGEDDTQTCDFLYKWAISEQTSSVRDLTDRVTELARQDAAWLLLLDREYGEVD
jgi:ferritin